MSEHGEISAERPGAGSGSPRAEDEVRRALAWCERGERDSLELLQQALCAFVSARRRDGATRDSVLGEVRQLVGESFTPERISMLPAVTREALAELTLQWCEKEYDSA